jgi:hypothetical protein
MQCDAVIDRVSQRLCAVSTKIGPSGLDMRCMLALRASTFQLVAALCNECLMAFGSWAPGDRSPPRKIIGCKR